MKVVISIIVLASIFILIKLSKRGKAELINHPLTAISKNGFLGFMLGDTIKFVWSRINHLGLMTQEELGAGNKVPGGDHGDQFNDYEKEAYIVL